jgi:hypothetical protein
MHAKCFKTLVVPVCGMRSGKNAPHILSCVAYIADYATSDLCESAELLGLRGVSCSSHGVGHLTLSLLMSYKRGAPCKARNFNVVYIYIYIWTYVESRLFLFAAQCFNANQCRNYPVAQLCVNTLLATKVTLITNGI